MTLGPAKRLILAMAMAALGLAACSKAPRGNDAAPVQTTDMAAATDAGASVQAADNATGDTAAPIVGGGAPHHHTLARTHAPLTTSPPPPPPVGEGPVSAQRADIERQLEAIPIRYNKPATLSFDHDTPIGLVVEVEGAGTGASAVQGLPGAQVTAVAKLNAKAAAELTGAEDEVAIHPKGPVSLPITGAANSELVWYVRALKPGSTTLTLQIYATVNIGAEQQQVRVRTFTDKFNVVMSPVSWAKYQIGQIDPIWKWLGLGTPVAIIVGVVGCRSHSECGPTVSAYARRPGKPLLSAKPPHPSRPATASQGEESVCGALLSPHPEGRFRS